MPHVLAEGRGQEGVDDGEGLGLRVLTGAEPALWPDVNLARYAAFYAG